MHRKLAPVMRAKVLGLLRLGRTGMSPLTISVPILGAYTLGEPLSLGVTLLYGVVGLCAHFFGFALNDILDHPIDRKVPYRQKHPLTTGMLSHREAWLFTLLQPIIAFSIYLFLLKGTHVGGAVLGLSLVLAVAYNLWSKRGRFPRILAELSLALSIGALCLSGSLARSSHIPQSSILFSISLTFIVLLLNSVSSGLKDLKTDEEAGARSFVRSTGSRVIEEDRIYISPTLWRYSATVQALVFISLIVSARLFSLSLLPVSVLMLLYAYGTLHLVMMLSRRSFSALRKSGPLINGYYNYFALCVLVFVSLSPFLKVLYGLMISLSLVMPWLWALRRWRGRPQGVRQI